MKIVLATENTGKLKEFIKLLNDYEIVSYSSEIGEIEIKEDGNSFSENALIKARTVYKALDKNSVVLADDSGIIVPALGGEPGIFSARYAGENRTDKDNNLKLINRLKSKGIDKTEAYYTASIALVYNLGEYVVHGWMYGYVKTVLRGDKGFGYDPLFTPNGFNNSLGELSSSIKSQISHRAKAVLNIKPILEMLKRSYR